MVDTFSPDSSVG